MFVDDVDPAKLARRLHAQFPGRSTQAQLGEIGARLYEVMLANAVTAGRETSHSCTALRSRRTYFCGQESPRTRQPRDLSRWRAAEAQGSSGPGA
ncbi:hypothetical protein [Actinomadura flavalba]|uniref:hypothetical protein n=1 Tax=Actinomadura flavalba TaxID=1120938 RepID=UPI003B831E39